VDWHGRVELRVWMVVVLVALVLFALVIL